AKLASNNVYEGPGGVPFRKLLETIADNWKNILQGVAVEYSIIIPGPGAIAIVFQSGMRLEFHRDGFGRWFMQPPRKLPIEKQNRADFSLQGVAREVAHSAMLRIDVPSSPIPAAGQPVITEGVTPSKPVLSPDVRAMLQSPLAQALGNIVASPELAA